MRMRMRMRMKMRTRTRILRRCDSRGWFVIVDTPVEELIKNFSIKLDSIQAMHVNLR